MAANEANSCLREQLSNRNLSSRRTLNRLMFSSNIVLVAISSLLCILPFLSLCDGLTTGGQLLYLSGSQRTDSVLLKLSAYGITDSKNLRLEGSATEFLRIDQLCNCLRAVKDLSDSAGQANFPLKISHSHYDPFSDSSVEEVVNLSFRIVPENEYIHFDQRRYSVEIPVDTEKGSIIDGLESIELVNSVGKKLNFQLKNRDGSDKPIPFDLLIDSETNRVSIVYKGIGRSQEYKLLLTAKNSWMEASTDVDITLFSVALPRFSKPMYSARISDQIPTGSAVVKVKANEWAKYSILVNFVCIFFRASKMS